MAFLEILDLGNRQLEAGKLEPAGSAIKRLRERRSDHRCPLDP